MTALLLYTIIWIVVLFLVLPWGVNIPSTIEEGHADSAPEKPHIGLKFLLTSLVAAFLWIILFLILHP